MGKFRAVGYHRDLIRPPASFPKGEATVMEGGDRMVPSPLGKVARRAGWSPFVATENLA